MSGGAFNYKQFQIQEIIDGIEREIEKQGKPKDKYELFGCDEYYQKYPEEKFYPTYSEEIQDKMKEGIRFLKIAQIYAHRIDWFLSGDDGEESFLKRLDDDLKEIE